MEQKKSKKKPFGWWSWIHRSLIMNGTEKSNRFYVPQLNKIITIPKLWTQDSKKDLSYIRVWIPEKQFKQWVYDLDENGNVINKYEKKYFELQKFLKLAHEWSCEKINELKLIIASKIVKGNLIKQIRAEAKIKIAEHNESIKKNEYMYNGVKIIPYDWNDPIDVNDENEESLSYLKDPGTFF